MSDKTERRALDRIKIPSAELFYKPLKRINILAILIGPTNLVNISKSGACFISQNNLKKGSDVYLKIVLPVQEPFYLKAKTIWTSCIHEQEEMSVGVQFKPFGEGKKYNSYKSKNVLEQIYSTYDN